MLREPRERVEQRQRVARVAGEVVAGDEPQAHGAPPRPPHATGHLAADAVAAPELVTFGLPPDAAEAVLNGVAERLRAGRPAAG